MAGIGFELRRLSAKGGIAAPLSSALHGASVVAGPWLLTIAAMAMLQRFLDITTPQAFALQSMIIYVFCISLIATAPVIAASQQLLAADLWASRFGRIRTLYLLTMVLCAIAGAAAGLVVFSSIFGFTGNDLLTSMLSVSATSIVWPAVAFAATAKAFRTITFGFFCGLVVAIAATLAALRLGSGPMVQAFAFANGLALAASFITVAVLRTFPSPAADLRAVLKTIARTAFDKRTIITGACFAVLAIWIDSIIVWASPYGTRVSSGLTTAPLYDSALFTARLTMLPGLIFHLISIDTHWFTAMHKFLGAIEGHGTLRKIEDLADRLRSLTNASMTRLMVIQGAATLMLLFLAPVYLPASGLAYIQMTTLRYGILGAFFHVVFFVASTLVLNCGREKAFTRLQLLFLTLNAIATASTLAFPITFLGMGYMGAAMLTAIAALFVLDRSLKQLTEETFADALAGSRRLASGPGLLARIWFSVTNSVRLRWQRRPDPNPQHGRTHS